MARKKRTTKKKSTVRKKVGRPRSARPAARSASKKKRTTKRTTKRTAKRTAKRTTKRGTRATTTSKRTSRATGTSELSMLHEQLMAGIAKLEDRRAELVYELAEIDRQIEEFRPGSSGAGASRPAPARRGPGRPRKSESAAPRKTGRRGGRAKGAGGKNLVESLRDVLSGTEMRVSDLVDAVQAAGYRTNSPNFRTIVNQALIKHKDIFSRVGRGVYTAK